MTLGKANELVRALIGEDDYHHMKGVLSGYYDIAQKQIATTVSPIKKSVSIECGVLSELPHDLYRLVSVGGSYQRPDKEHIKIEGTGTAEVRYYAYPSDITELTPEGTEFEIAPEAQNAIPYFAAAYAVLSDSDMRRYYAFSDMYNSVLANIAAADGEQAVITVVRTEEM